MLSVCVLAGLRVAFVNCFGSCLVCVGGGLVWLPVFCLLFWCIAWTGGDDW